MISSILFLIVLKLIGIINGNIPSEINHIKQHLEKFAQQLSIAELVKIPKASFYLNSHLTQNIPHQIVLTKQLTSIISEWSPQILASDPTCPYYFSKIIHSSSSKNNHLNLLSYLQAIESNETMRYPFINILPQSYRSALPLPSIFQCKEFVHPSVDPFFYNIELILGPGQTELSFEHSTIEYSQFYCSLYGSSNILLINQTNEKFLFENTSIDMNYFSINLTSGTCLFIPSNWMISIQFNNSISLRFIFQTMIGKFNELCTKIEQVTLDKISFSIKDSLNISAINLMIYFYQYLNPPYFDRQYTSTQFLHQFQIDRNISQLIIKWTFDLIELIEIELFQQLDINNDQIFNINDYYYLQPSNVKYLEEILPKIFENIQQIILIQYKQLSETIQRISQQVSNNEFNNDDKEILITTINNLPESVKENFQRNHIDLNDVLNKISHAKTKSSTKKKFNRIDL